MTRVFLHSPLEVPYALALTLLIPEYERYGERALLLARPSDIVCLAHPVDGGYLDFLRGLELGPHPEDVVVVEEGAPDAGMSARFLGDPGALDRLAARLPHSGPVELNPFYAAPTTFALGRALRTRLGRPVRVTGGPPALVGRLNGKGFTKELARSLEVPVAPGDLVAIPPAVPDATRDVAELRDAIERWLASTGRVIVRGISGASGSSTFTLGSGGVDGLVEAVALRTDNFQYLVEPLFELTSSPNIEVIVERGGATPRVGATDQILTPELVYQGSAHPSRASRLHDMVADALRIAAWMRSRGFTGRVGFDFVEHDRGADGAPGYFLAEINPRVNGASYPLALLARLVSLAGERGAPEPAAFRTDNIPVHVRDYAALEESCGSLFYDPAVGEGVVPYAVGRLFIGKVGVASFAGTPARAAELFTEFASRAGAGEPALPVPAP